MMKHFLFYLSQRQLMLTAEIIKYQIFIWNLCFKYVYE